MLCMRFVRRALITATVLTGLAGVPAQAQQIDSIVAFGDSYADSGNAFELGYANPNAILIYPTGRFSGGVNYVDVLSNLLSAPVDNFAIGGALASTNNSLICFDPVYGAPLCGKGFEYEVDQFLGVGPQSPVFPTVDTSLDESDLLTISIGGNDSRAYQQLGGTLALAPLAGAAAASAATAQINRIIGTGTPTISFIAGNTGRLPEIAGDPAGAAVRSAFSDGFNTAMQQTLAGYAADGSIVHYLDLNIVLDNIIANPGAYGITSGIACPAAPNPTCLSNASGYLFYLDGLHLTSRGFEIVAQYVAAQVNAPLMLQAPADLGVDNARQLGRLLSARLPQGSAVTGLRLFAMGDGFTANHGETRGNNAFRNEGYGATIGAEYGFGAGGAGVALRLSRPKADFGNESARVRNSSGQIGGYAGLGFGSGGYVNAFLGYGWDDYDIQRRGVVENMDASPNGHHWLAGIKGGYMIPMGWFSAGPIAGLDYARSKVNGYTEDGDPALTLDVSSQSLKSLRGNLGLEARTDLGEDYGGLRPYLAVMAEKEFSSDGRSVTFFQTSAPVIVNNFQFERTSKRAYGRVNVGGYAAITGALSVDAGMSLTVGKKHGNETSGQVALSLAF